ncbi:V-set domain containing T-cell activation inhibitor 1 isoform X2 [Amia ocellicauda]|uniref:V-set domain containing T-cell activation inhibitor 1 isoform X2 n=1 Tax=Amia ocellicauda TaxID=2972642 RepID=UPI003463B662
MNPCAAPSAKMPSWEKAGPVQQALRKCILAVLLFLFLSPSSFSVSKEWQVRVWAGGTVSEQQDVLLGCSFLCQVGGQGLGKGAPQHLIIEWLLIRPEAVYVVLHLDMDTQNSEQHPLFQGRVELASRQCGNASLLLHRALPSDSGRFSCHVMTEYGRGRGFLELNVTHETPRPDPDYILRRRISCVNESASDPPRLEEDPAAGTGR